MNPVHPPALIARPCPQAETAAPLPRREPAEAARRSAARSRRARLLSWLIAGLALALAAAHAFPPAPYHTLHGLVRNEYGQPLNVTGAQMIFESTNGTQVTGTIVPGLEPGLNYRLAIPMDSGIAPDKYKPTAFRPTLPFLLRVKIGQATYLPMELSGNYANLGKPAESTRLDLTLGVDANSDGLPDAWQELIRLMFGPNAGTGPNDDPDGDGLTNWQEYYLGTYPFIPDDGFRLALLKPPGAGPVLEFTVSPPRTYSIQTSTNLRHWSPLTFTIPANGTNDPARPYYTATDVRVLRVAPLLPAGSTHTDFFFRLMVQ